MSSCLPPVITSIAMAGFGVSATIWMPNVVTRNEAQFGFFGVALALVTWFSVCAPPASSSARAGAGPVFAEDPGSVGRFVRGGADATLTPGARPVPASARTRT